VAITPPSDIVLDVARAADPETYRAAVERLTRLRATAAASTTTFMPATQAPAAPATGAAATLGAGAGAQPRRRLDAYGQFESFVLQSFVQSMLPKNATNVFGKGSAGEFWKSMLAEKMGDELARSGQVGIARRLAAGPSHPVLPGAADVVSPLSVPPSLLSTLTNVQARPPDGADVVDPAAAPAPADSERN
jgi:hypothetical protein